MTSEPVFGPLGGTDGVVVRRAALEDVPALPALLADDPLTTDKSRADALRFYERLGFVASHEGLTVTLGG